MKKIGTLLLYVTFCLCLNAQVSLGPTLSTFGVLSYAGVTNTGPTTVVGNLGVFPLTAITGFTGILPGGPGTVTGTIYSGSAVAGTAQNELTAAYNTALNLPSNSTNPPDLGGTTVSPGVHTSSSTLGITGDVTLDGLNNPNSIFVFQIGSGLTTASGSRVVLINQASAANVYWQVRSSATLGAGSTISGNILAQASISFDAGATLTGRALARTGAVTLISNSVNSPGGSGGGPPPPPPPPPIPAPSSLILVAIALLFAALYQGRERLLKLFRRN